MCVLFYLSRILSVHKEKKNKHSWASFGLNPIFWEYLISSFMSGVDIKYRNL